ncbi:MAG TPA: cache domain-containing protein [Rhizobiaceae bacterium]|nr:cache domain-containing protein [Rhizobiaceae bacterium]
MSDRRVAFAPRRISDIFSTNARSSAEFSTKAAIWLISALFLLFLLVLVFSTLQGRREAQRRAEDRAFAASEVVATNARWIVELSQQALRRIDEALGPDIDNRKSDTVTNINDAVDSLPGIVKAYVVTADGRTLYSTDPGVQPIDIRDRPYFADLAKGAPWYVSPLLVSRLNGDQIFVFSRRLERDGQFVGAAIISFNVLVLADIWRSLQFDADSTVGLIRDDGQLIARYPLAEGPLDMSGYVLFTDYLKRNREGIYTAVSPADGVQRFVGYRRVEGTSLIAVASVSAASAFVPFWRSTLTTLALALPALLALGGAAWWIAHLLRQDTKRQIELARAMEANQLLFKDIHHRVKNNLQSVQSLVRMQPIPAEVKADLQRRIAAMTAVHEHIYRLDQYVEVDAQLLLPAIVEPLVTTFGQDVKVDFNIDPLEVERDAATPLALLVNELVTNSLKYAFAERGSGTIKLALKDQGDGRVQLVISDDGVGFEPEASSTGMGSRLIKAMVLQLDGTYSYRVDGGTIFEADLAIRSAAQQPIRVAGAAA